MPVTPASAQDQLSIQQRTTVGLTATELAEVRALCTEAYGEDFAPYLETIGPGVHLLGRLGGQLVAHVMWVTRMLAAAGCGPLRTAYVEAVATRPAFRRRGIATALLKRLAAEVRSYDLAALSPSEHQLYERLGWALWRGPLFIREEGRLLPTPGEEVMFLRLPGTPADLDPGAALSAEWRAGELW